jgi:hypothetical protein
MCCRVPYVLTRLLDSALRICIFEAIFTLLCSFSSRESFFFLNILDRADFILLPMPPSQTSCEMILLLLCSLSSLSWQVIAFTTPSLPHNPSRFLSAPALGVANLRDADFLEMMLGGERYEMVPLPFSIFVGNLNEFVKDDDLSNLFQTVSALQSLPACVCRRANWDSLQYGFVTFPTVEEKVVRTTRKPASVCLGFKK